MSSKAFGLTAYYDAMIANWFNKKLKIKFPERKTIFWKKITKIKIRRKSSSTKLYICK